MTQLTGRIHVLDAFSAILLLEIQFRKLQEMKLARGNQFRHLSELAKEWAHQTFENSSEAAKNYGFFFFQIL